MTTLETTVNLSISSKATKESALSLITAWVATIADNVNNPVASTLATIDMIEREQANRRATGTCDDLLIDDSLSRIRERLRYLSEYVTELVNFGKPSLIDPTMLDTRAGLQVVRKEIRVLPGAELTVEVSKGAERIYADASRFRVAIKCLALNGLEAAYLGARDGQRPRIVIGAGATTVDTVEGIAVTVDDNGPGFSDAARERGGEPFFSTKEAGTGLGLAIAKKIASAHGGSLILGSSPTLGGGRVTIFLPLPRSATRIGGTRP